MEFLFTHSPFLTLNVENTATHGLYPPVKKVHTGSSLQYLCYLLVPVAHSSPISSSSLPFVLGSKKLVCGKVDFVRAIAALNLIHHGKRAKE